MATTTPTKATTASAAKPPTADDDIRKDNIAIRVVDEDAASIAECCKK
jgi:hypothetical protein